MTHERWAVAILMALYALVGTIEFESDRKAEARGVYAPGPAIEEPDLFMW
jgi:hypothetical protein